MCKNATEILQKNGQQNFSRISARFLTGLISIPDIILPFTILISFIHIWFCYNLFNWLVEYVLVAVELYS